MNSVTSSSVAEYIPDDGAIDSYRLDFDFFEQGDGVELDDWPSNYEEQIEGAD